MLQLRGSGDNGRTANSGPLPQCRERGSREKYDTFIGLDVHARSISARALNPRTGEVTGGGSVRRRGPSLNGPSRLNYPQILDPISKV